MELHDKLARELHSQLTQLQKDTIHLQEEAKSSAVEVFGSLTIWVWSWPWVIWSPALRRAPLVDCSSLQCSLHLAVRDCEMDLFW